MKKIGIVAGVILLLLFLGTIGQVAAQTLAATDNNATQFAIISLLSPKGQGQFLQEIGNIAARVARL